MNAVDCRASVMRWTTLGENGNVFGAGEAHAGLWVPVPTGPRWKLLGGKSSWLTASSKRLQNPYPKAIVINSLKDASFMYAIYYYMYWYFFVLFHPPAAVPVLIICNFFRNYCNLTIPVLVFLFSDTNLKVKILTKGFNNMRQLFIWQLNLRWSKKWVSNLK